MGVHTGKVLWFGWRNKYCARCKWAESKGVDPPPHQCFMNWTSSANSMESDIIAEGFRCSEDMYGVRYKWFVGDGDSNVYKKIFTESPYDNCPVEKIECSNHLLRNFCFHLEELVGSGDNKRGLKRGQTVGLRKNISKNIIRMRNAIVKACEYWRDAEGSIFQKIQKLKADILNCPKHVFGDHGNCAKYFCKGRKGLETNLVPVLTTNNLWSGIMEIFNRLADHSRSLIHLMNNNQVESLNAIICKLVGGKRINFVQRGSYVMRLMMAAVSKNTNQRHFRALHKHMCDGKSPGKFAKQHENKVVSSRAKDRTRLAQRQRRKGGAKRDADYGNAAQRVQRTAEDVIAELEAESERWEEIERDTRVQGTPYWHRLRKFRITGSNFGKVCKRKQDTRCGALVRQMLYDNFAGNEHTEWGHRAERKAIAQYMHDNPGVVIHPAGLCIDREKPFLAASPDGMVDDGEGLVEVKSPSTMRNLKPIDAIRGKADVAFKIGKNGEAIFNPEHEHFYQMQGQMHITKRSYCIYIVWTTAGYITEKVLYDKNFWKNKMEQKLVDFYHDCLLVEIVEQNFLMGQPIKDPPRIVDARNNKPPPKRKNDPPRDRQNAKQKKLAKTA